MNEKCTYHDELVADIRALHSSMLIVEKAIVTLNNTCEKLNETTVTQKEFYQELLSHNTLESDNRIGINKTQILIYALIAAVCFFCGNFIPPII